MPLNPDLPDRLPRLDLRSGPRNLLRSACPTALRPYASAAVRRFDAALHRILRLFPQTTAADRDQMAAELNRMSADNERLAIRCALYESAVSAISAERDRVAREAKIDRTQLRLEQLLNNLAN